MDLLYQIVQLPSSIREVVAPRYRPELHYMRGPGPAYARRLAMLEAARQIQQMADSPNAR